MVAMDCGEKDERPNSLEEVSAGAAQLFQRLTFD
jgi:hypothetical protein